ncbi:MAG: type II toxin-antitoxin system RelE/ParE family toxin [Magnetospirillum sp.]|nr:type II toxin-antitoxin system RelE/ParE family toxin [Magnetospirillum sp.]
MTRKIVFRPHAETDLISLYRYIAAASDLERAGSYLARIEEACMALADFPERGTMRDDIAPGLRTIGFERRVTIAFRVLDHSVEIVTIAYAGRQFEDH